MRRQSTVSLKDISTLEECINAVFPETQGFFAYFLFYCGDRNFPVFVASGTFAALG